MDLDISNDPEVERLGANATALYALEFWETLSVAARRDGRDLDPLWSNDNDNDDDDEDNHNKGSTTSKAVTTPIVDAHYTKQIVLTSSLEADVRLHKRFRSNFGNFPIASLGTNFTNTTNNNNTTTTNNNSHTNPLGGDRWTFLLLASEGVIPDYNFMTLLRANALDMFWMTEANVCDGLIIVPRAQFVYLEVTRIQEGSYGRDFRRQLQLLDVKTQSDILMDAIKSITAITNTAMKKKQGDITDTDDQDNEEKEQAVMMTMMTKLEQRVLQALDLLQTQWPFPNVTTFRETGVIPIIKRTASTFQSLSNHNNNITNITNNKIPEACRQLLQYWQDVYELGRIPHRLPHLFQKEKDTNGNSKSSSRNRRRQQRIMGALQRAGQALNTFSSSSSSLLPLPSSTSVIPHLIEQESVNKSHTKSTFFSTVITTKTTNSLADVTLDVSHININKKNGSSNTAVTAAANTSIISSAKVFQQYGLLVLDQFLSHDTLQQCQEHAHRALQELIQEQLQPRGLQVNGQNAFDFPFCRQRPGHRVDNRYHILDDPTSPIAKLGQELLQTLPTYLFATEKDDAPVSTEQGDDSNNNNNSSGMEEKETMGCTGKNNGYKILYGGVVHSFPKSLDDESFPPAQIWHRDGPSLFTSTHHETHCFNVFIPLVDVHSENGTTEFIPGTHADVVFEELATHAIPLAQRDPNAQPEQAVRALVKAGTVIVFDIRVLHRGLANTSQQDRPVLYFTIAKDWFLESHMFQTPSSSSTSPPPLEVPASTTTVPVPSSVDHSQVQLTQRLYELVTEQPPQHDEQIDNYAYGHPHYTTRFDLLLLEQIQLNDINNQNTNSGLALQHLYSMADLFLLLEEFQSTDDHHHNGGGIALQNLQAILAFSMASAKDRNAMAQEFIDSFGTTAVQRKQQMLQAAHDNRRRPVPIVMDDTKAATTPTNGDTNDSGHDNTNNNNHSTDSPVVSNGIALQDFSTIERDMSDVTALYKLTATIVLEESVLLSKLGFTPDEHGVCVLLALLKANAKHSILTTSDSGSMRGITMEQLEEAFTNWWHAGEGRFAFWRLNNKEGDKNDQDVTTTSPQPKKKLLVVFSSLGSGIARPEWYGSLGGIVKELSSSLDVLHVLDPAFSWYCQDPTCQWQGGDYYFSQLSEYTRHYESVMFLGDSMGAAAALRFSCLANAVVAFTPQVDISNYEAITRLDFLPNVKQDFKEKVIEAVKDTTAVIDIHYGDKCDEDNRQVLILPKQSNINLHAHDFDDHILSLHLREIGQLKGLIEDAVRKFAIK